MPKPYSQDLRDRVIDAVKRGMSRRAAARHYEISESVAIKWLERVERDGSRTSRSGTRPSGLPSGAAPAARTGRASASAAFCPSAVADLDRFGFAGCVARPVAT